MTTNCWAQHLWNVNSFKYILTRVCKYADHITRRLWLLKWTISVRSACRLDLINSRPFVFVYISTVPRYKTSSAIFSCESGLNVVLGQYFEELVVWNCDVWSWKHLAAGIRGTIRGRRWIHLYFVLCCCHHIVVIDITWPHFATIMVLQAISIQCYLIAFSHTEGLVTPKHSARD